MSWSHDEIEALLAVAEEGSILGAATRLDTSRARIRRKIASLESLTQTMLITRDERGLEMTAAGLEMVAHGRRLAREASLLVKRVGEIGNAPRGVVHVAFPIGPPDAYWAAGFAQLRKQFPKVSVSIHFAPDPVALLPHKVETAVSFSDHVPDSCVAIKGRSYRIRLIASKKYIEKYGEPKNLDDLGRHDVIAWRSPQGYQGLPLARGGHLEKEPACLHDDVALLRKMAEMAVGLVWVPILMPLEDSMQVVLDDQIVGSMRAHFVVPKIFQNVPRVRALWEMVEGLVHQDQSRFARS